MLVYDGGDLSYGLDENHGPPAPEDEEPGEYPCRFCNAPTVRVGGFCSRDCEKDWRDGRLGGDVIE
jgi:hypothetical protein